MNIRRKQQGISLSAFLGVGLVIVFLAFIVAKFAPIYFENYSVKSVLTSLNRDKVNTTSAIGLRKTIEKRFYINDIRRVHMREVSVRPVKEGYRVEVDYEVVVPMLSNISVIIKFNDHVVVKQYDSSDV